MEDSPQLDDIWESALLIDDGGAEGLHPFGEQDEEEHHQHRARGTLVGAPKAARALLASRLPAGHGCGVLVAPEGRCASPWLRQGGVTLGAAAPTLVAVGLLLSALVCTSGGGVPPWRSWFGQPLDRGLRGAAAGTPVASSSLSEVLQGKARPDPPEEFVRRAGHEHEPEPQPHRAPHPETLAASSREPTPTSTSPAPSAAPSRPLLLAAAGSLGTGVLVLMAGSAWASLRRSQDLLILVPRGLSCRCLICPAICAFLLVAVGVSAVVIAKTKAGLLAHVPHLSQASAPLVVEVGLGLIAAGGAAALCAVLGVRSEEVDLSHWAIFGGGKTTRSEARPLLLTPQHEQGGPSFADNGHVARFRPSTNGSSMDSMGRASDSEQVSRPARSSGFHSLKGIHLESPTELPVRQGQPSPAAGPIESAREAVQVASCCRGVVLGLLLVGYAALCALPPLAASGTAPSCHAGADSHWAPHAAFAAFFFATKAVELGFYAVDPDVTGQLPFWRIALLVAASGFGMADGYLDGASAGVAAACSREGVAGVDMQLLSKLWSAMAWSFYIGVVALQWGLLGCLSTREPSCAILARLLHMDALASALPVGADNLWLWRLVTVVRTVCEDIPQTVQQVFYVLRIQRNSLMLLSIAVSAVCTLRLIFEGCERLTRERRAAQKLPGGQIYCGEWRCNQRDGYGDQIWLDGSEYHGQWAGDRADGEGRFRAINGDIYEGQWRAGLAHGHGTYKHADGSVYDGQWAMDKQHGVGVETWLDGAKYHGQYVNGYKCGNGSFTSPDGSSFAGALLDNDFHGPGSYVWPDGRKYEGQWQRNRMHGRGRFEWADGRVYEGEYLEDEKEGRGVFMWPDGRVYDGTWRKGRQHGTGVFTTAKGEIKSGTWVEGKRVKPGGRNVSPTNS